MKDPAAIVEYMREVHLKQGLTIWRTSSYKLATYEPIANYLKENKDNLDLGVVFEQLPDGAERFTVDFSMTPHYYKNQHGVDLNKFLQTIAMDGLALAEGGYLFNMMKYNARAGKKLGEPAQKDLNKADDYRQLLIKEYGYDADALDDMVAQVVADFQDYKG